MPQCLAWGQQPRQQAPGGWRRHRGGSDHVDFRKGRRARIRGLARSLLRGCDTRLHHGGNRGGAEQCAECRTRRRRAYAYINAARPAHGQSVPPKLRGVLTSSGGWRQGKFFQIGPGTFAIKGSQGWGLISLLRRKPRLVAAVALANKTARVAWAIMSRRKTYRHMTASDQCSSRKKLLQVGGHPHSRWPKKKPRSTWRLIPGLSTMLIACLRVELVHPREPTSPSTTACNNLQANV